MRNFGKEKRIVTPDSRRFPFGSGGAIWANDSWLQGRKKDIDVVGYLDRYSMAQ